MNNINKILNNKIVNNKSVKTKTKNFNKLAANAVKSYEFKNGKNMTKGRYKTEKEYQDSFDDILQFQKKYSDIQKKAINVVIFHDDNNDGVISAYIAWKYLVNDNKKDVKFLPMKPHHGQNVNRRISGREDIINNGNVLILDISYGNNTFDYINKRAKSMIVIDDHVGTTRYSDPNIFVGDGHATVGYTWKFFYPKEKVPKIVQYVDDSDGKLFLPFISFSNLFSVSLGFRFVHNIFKSMGPDTFGELHELFKDDNVNFFIFVGRYFEEVRDHLKNQIAANARIQNFQGYKVGTLNMNIPSLSKNIGRQIVTNMKDKIDFAVLFGYEFSLADPAWRVQLIDDHMQTKIDLGKLGEKLGKIGGHNYGGGGHFHVANFYWKNDVFDLFRKKYI